MKKSLLLGVLLSFISVNLLCANEKIETLSRYEAAIELAAKLAELENNTGSFSKVELIELEKKCVDCSDELAKLGINVSSLEKDMATVKEDIDVLKNDVAAIKAEDNEKLKLKGKYIFENRNVIFKSDDVKDVHRTYATLELEGTAKVDEDIELHTKWRLIKDADLTGNNFRTSDVKVAEMIIRNAFNSDGQLRLGRSYYWHGSGFVLNDEMDGISYVKQNGDTNIEYGMYFEKQISESYHPIFNVYLERNKSRKKYYFDLFYNTYEDGEYKVSYVNNIKKRNVKDCSILLFNAGLLGQFGKNNDFEYLVDGVVSQYHDDNHKDKNQTGFAGHASIRYTPKNSDFSGLIAYNILTHDCYEELGTKTRDNSWDNFEDMSFDDKYWDYGHKLIIPNTQDFRILLSYRPKQYQKHKLEFNYDFIRGVDSNKPYGHILEEDAYLGLNLKSDLWGIEYSYEVSKNTDFVINYENQRDITFGGLRDSYNLIFSLISKF